MQAPLSARLRRTVSMLPYIAFPFLWSGVSAQAATASESALPQRLPCYRGAEAGTRRRNPKWDWRPCSPGIRFMYTLDDGQTCSISHIAD